MGAALVTTLAKAGHDVTVWNRTASKAAPLRDVGARVATSVADAVSQAELVIGILTEYETTNALFAEREVQRALSGKTFIELASGTPKQAQRAALRAAELGIRYLDGAIMATPDFIGKPGCTILYSGSPDLFEPHEAALVALADNSVLVGGEIGHANALDNAILVVLWGAVHGMLQGTAIAEAEKLPLSVFQGALKGSWPIIEPTLMAAIERIGRRSYTADATTAATVAICHASVRHVRAISEAHGIDLGLPRALDTIFQRAVDSGHGESDIAAVYEGMR